MPVGVVVLAASVVLGCAPQGGAASSTTSAREPSTTPTSATVAATVAMTEAPGPATTATPAPTRPPRVLLLGDSITQGSTQRLGPCVAEYYSYRAYLWGHLVDAGAAVDFVGTLRDPCADAPQGTWDPDHEGHWGWRADQVAGELAGWLAAGAPDVAVVHLGTNDVHQARPLPATIAAFDSIVATLRSANPEVAVLVALVIPSTQASVEPLNTALAAFARDQATDASPVVAVDLYTGYDPSWNPDGVHPGREGQQYMAARLSGALMALLPRVRSVG